MTILYSQFKSFNQSYSRISQSMSSRSMLLLVISTVFVVFTSFFVSLFIVMISLGLLPFTAFRLWLVKRKTQKYSDSNMQYSDFINVNEHGNRVIEAEYTVIKSDSDKIKH